jgi:cytochrome b pre-mRNA-processing protein 3
MIFKLFRRTPWDRTIASLYGTIVAQARAPAFYQIYGVPDTVNGRFEMVVLHAVLLLHRLRAEPALMEPLGQGIFDMFCKDMDGTLREMGVGDLAVPRSMRRIGEAFYGRQSVYEAALAAEPALATPNLLAAALGRNVFGTASEPAAGAERLAAYVLEAVRHLAAQDAAALGRAELRFPLPDQVSAGTRIAVDPGES